MRCASIAKPASLIPNVVGSACTPCVRPTQTVSTCSRARSDSALTSSRAPRRMISPAARSCSPVAVSSTSLEVRPKWIQRPASPADALRTSTNAATSWSVTASRSCTACDGERGGADRLQLGLGRAVHRLAGGNLDAAPRLHARLVGPQGAHLGPGVAIDHGPSIEQSRRWTASAPTERVGGGRRATRHRRARSDRDLRRALADQHARALLRSELLGHCSRGLELQRHPLRLAGGDGLEVRAGCVSGRVGGNALAGCEQRRPRQDDPLRPPVSHRDPHAEPSAVAALARGRGGEVQHGGADGHLDLVAPSLGGRPWRRRGRCRGGRLGGRRRGRGGGRLSRGRRHRRDRRGRLVVVPLSFESPIPRPTPIRPATTTTARSLAKPRSSSLARSRRGIIVTEDRSSP